MIKNKITFMFLLFLFSSTINFCPMLSVEAYVHQSNQNLQFFPPMYQLMKGYFPSLGLMNATGFIDQALNDAGIDFLAILLIRQPTLYERPHDSTSRWYKNPEKSEENERNASKYADYTWLVPQERSAES
jgi:hypothetical protein